MTSFPFASMHFIVSSSFTFAYFFGTRRVRVPGACNLVSCLGASSRMAYSRAYRLRDEFMYKLCHCRHLQASGNFSHSRWWISWGLHISLLHCRRSVWSCTLLYFPNAFTEYCYPVHGCWHQRCNYKDCT